MKLNEQTWFTYGNRSNKFLLENYGFSYADNIYDSYQFFVKMDMNLEE